MITLVETINFSKKHINSENIVDSLNRKLKAYGIDTQPIIQSAIKSGEKAIHELKRGNFDISSIFKTELNTNLKKNFQESKSKMSLPESVLISVLLIATIFVIALLSKTILVGLFGKVLGMAALRVFISPVLEECVRFLSIKFDSSGSFFIFFIAAELIQYRESIEKSIPTVAMHLVNTVLQKFGHDIGKSSETLWISIVFHSIWNALAALSR